MTLQVILGGIDLSGTSGVDVAGAQWSIDTFSGWGGVGSTITVTQRVRAPGGWAGDAFGTSRHITLSGQVAAPDQDTLTAAIDRLINACTFSSSTMTVIENSRTRNISVRREDEVLFAYISDKMASWSIQMVSADPRKLATALVGTTMLPVSSGGLTWPHAWPETWTATTISGQVSLTNPGNTVGPVVLRIDGPATGPSIAHSGATGSSITFAASLVLGAGEWLTINMDTHQVLANDQSNRAQYITSAGWSGFDPGVNTWSLSASTYNAATMLTVTAFPAWT